MGSSDCASQMLRCILAALQGAQNTRSMSASLVQLTALTHAELSHQTTLTCGSAFARSTSCQDLAFACNGDLN